MTADTRSSRIPAVLVMVLAGAVAAVTSNAWLGFACCIALACAAAVFAAQVAYPRGAAPDLTRTLVVLGALAYLVGLPTTSLVLQHVGALADAVPELGNLVALPYLSFLFVFMAVSRGVGRRPRQLLRA